MATSVNYSGSVLNASDEYQPRSVLSGSDEILEDIIVTKCEPCQKGGKRTKNAVKYCVNCSEKMCKKCSKLHLRFKRSQKHVFNNIKPVSPVTTGSSTSTPRLVSTIDITTSKDVNKPNICDGGLTVVQRRYCVVTEETNKCIKVVDTRKARVTSEVDLTEVDSLWALTSVNDDQVAVSARINDDEKLLFLSVSSKGIISKTYHSVGVILPFVHSILHCKDHFYASEEFSNTIHVVNTQGQKITTITNNSFEDLTGIAVSNDHNTIYVCSNGNDTVFSLDLNGKVKATYKDKNLKEPEGVTVDAEGFVYVCSAGTNSVHKLSADISVGHVIISDVSLLSCAFNKIDNRLYLGQGSKIKVYEV